MTGVPAVDRIWRGRIEIAGSPSDKLDGLEVFMPKTSYPKAVKVIRSMQPSICFSMQGRPALWPKHFDVLGAAHDDISLFLLPEMSSSTEYDNLVELMIANDLAMTSHINNLELIIFTSLEQEDNHQQIQGKYYLWGILKGKGLRRCKPSKVKKIHTPKRALVCAKKSKLGTQIPLSGRTAVSIEHQLITATPSPVNSGWIPPLSNGCKRARSKRRIISTPASEEANFCQAAVKDFPDSPLLDFTEKVTTKDKIIDAEQHSWDSNMEIDEPSDSFGIHAERTDEPNDDVAKGLLAPMVATDLQKRSCLTLLRDKEESHILEANLPAHGEINSCLDEKTLGNHLDRVVDDQPNIITNALPGTSEISARAAKVHQPECQTSGLLLEKGPSTIPLLDSEEAGLSSSSTDTVVLGLDDDEQTTMKEFQTSDGESDVITTSSMLKISAVVQESCSNTSRVQVGRYTIRSDLAPILTKILKKHGDIALGCSVMPEVLLEDICKAVQDIEPVSFSGLRYHHLDRLRNLCQLGEALKIDTKWLSKRCDDLEKTALQISQYLSLKEQMSQYTEAIRSLEKKSQLNRDIVASLLQENQSLEEKCGSLKERQENMRFEVEFVRSESRRFLGKSVVDGLF
ncbi:hypothetical protein vseg_018785 [Gypsophila vaccaria]